MISSWIEKVNRIALAVLINCVSDGLLFVDRLYISLHLIPARNTTNNIDSEICEIFKNIPEVEILKTI